MITSSTVSDSAQHHGGLAGLRAREPVFPPGLLMDMQTMLERLWQELEQGPTLDAYLLAAGVGQVADDHLHAPTYPLGRAAPYLAARKASAARVAGAAAGALDSVARAARTRQKANRELLNWRRVHARLVHCLAAAQVAELLGAAADPVMVKRASASAAARSRRAKPPVAPPVIDIAAARAGLQLALGMLPATLRASVAKLPSCFCHFDQRPDDVLTLTRRFAERWPDRSRRLLVAGIRTSGSYLAPLCAASLEALGYQRVSTLTVRPGHGLLPEERALVRSIDREDGLALVIDDPPVSGRTIRDAVAILERAGVQADAVTLVLATFGPPDLPQALHGFQAVLLEGAEWSVGSDLQPAAVKRALAALGEPGREVLDVEALAAAVPLGGRGHRRALFRVWMRGPDGARTHQSMMVEGVGIGYLGAHRLAAPALLERFSPRVFALRDGLLYREWLEDGQRLAAPIADEEAVAAVLVSYVAQRQITLACPRDLSTDLVDETPAWLVASKILSAGFGRGWPLARVLATDRAVQHVLRVTRPSLVDGNTDLAQWFWRPGPGVGLLKPDIGEDRFSNLTAWCFDAAFDLAGMTARSSSRELPAKLRRAFFQLTGEHVSPERWLLYELVHLWGHARTQPQELHALTRAGARAMQRYFVATHLDDIPCPVSGPLCALDLDGVLETQQLGFPALTPTAALALRALRGHGYRPVLATGRSLGEARERCLAYGLAGAVAEYGSAMFNADDGQLRSLLDERQLAVLSRLRTVLSELDGVTLDPDYEHAVRAYRAIRGRRRPLSPAQLACVMASVGDTTVEVVPGEGQTDFIAAGVNKGAGLRELASALGQHSPRPYAFAVGDTVADLPLVRVAGRALAPRHSDLALGRAGFERLSGPYQAGLAQAVDRVIGHQPGGCPRCRLQVATSERAILRALLDTPGRGPLRMAISLLELRWRARP